MDMGYDRGLEDEREEWAREQERERRDRGEVRTDWKPLPKRPSVAMLYERPAWRLDVLKRDGRCLVHASRVGCAEGWEAHHVVPQQTLRRTHAELLWHPLSGMLVCGLAHRQHHSRARPIRLDEIPPEVAAFLTAQGFGWYLERHYPARPQEPVSDADEL